MESNLTTPQGKSYAAILAFASPPPIWLLITSFTFDIASSTSVEPVLSFCFRLVGKVFVWGSVLSFLHPVRTEKSE
ncbi:MAG: hypothetical protein NVV82_16015 [Sporocytophaga sp.]|nr:hypothetical protein [Sporocytophaga sp.]